MIRLHVYRWSDSVMVKRSLFVTAAVISALFVAAPATAQLYKWVDQPPPADAQKVEQKRLPGVAPAASGASNTALPLVVQEAQRRNPVTLYTSSECGQFCNDGRNFLVARGIPYAEKNVSGNPMAIEEVVKLVGKAQVPVLTIGTQPIAGWEAGAWGNALDAAGYPRSNPLNVQQRAAQAEAAKAAATPPTPAPAAAAGAAAPAPAAGAPAGGAGQPPAAGTPATPVATTPPAR
jgi:glutaredoxin